MKSYKAGGEFMAEDIVEKQTHRLGGFTDSEIVKTEK